MHTPMNDIFVNTLFGTSAARAEVPHATGRTPVLRFNIQYQRHDLKGHHEPTELSLWLEPHEAVALADSIRSALAKKMPETQLPEQEPDDESGLPRLLS